MKQTHRRIGDGKHPVLVLHGWFGDSGSFGPVEPYLDVQGFSYVFMDYRGYGERKNVAGSYSIDEIAWDALGLADVLGFSEFSLLGHSMGGMAAEKVACLAPERVRSLVGIAPVPACGMRYDEAGLELLARATDELEVRRQIIHRSTGSRLPYCWVEWKAGYSWRCSTREAYQAYGEAWVHTDFSSQITHQRPMKILVGEHDPTFSEAHMRSTVLTWHPEAEIEILPNAGHYPMNETPLALVSRVEQFLRQY